MSAARGIADRPDLDQGRANLPLYVDGVLPRALPGQAYEGRLQIHNAIGECTAELVSGNLPPGHSLSVDQATQEVVLTWPAYTEQAAPIQNPGFEDGAMGWDFGAGWSVTTDNPIAGARSAAYDNNHGDSFIESRSWLPTNVGDVVNASCAVRQGASSSGNAGGAVRLQYRDAAGQVVYTVEGNPITQGSNNVVRTSNVTGITPASAVTINVAGRGIRKRQNRRVWMDSFAWDHKVPAVGINIETQICVTIRVRDSAGRAADWAGCFAVLLWDYSWVRTTIPVVGNRIAWSAQHNTLVLLNTGTGSAVRTFYSTDHGTTWNNANGTSDGASNYRHDAIAYSPDLDRMVMTNALSGFYHYSDDGGHNWTFQNLGTAYRAGEAVCWAPDLQEFLAVGGVASGTNARTARSSDGITWTATSLGTATDFPVSVASVVRIPELGLYVSTRASAGTPSVRTSATGAAGWANPALPATVYAMTGAIAWSPALGVGILGCNQVGQVSYPTVMLHTTDFVTFTPIDRPYFAALGFTVTAVETVVWSPLLQMFVALTRNGPNSSDARIALVSANGTDWVVHPIGDLGGTLLFMDSLWAETWNQVIAVANNNSAPQYLFVSQI